MKHKNVVHITKSLHRIIYDQNFERTKIFREKRKKECHEKVLGYLNEIPDHDRDKPKLPFSYLNLVGKEKSKRERYEHRRERDIIEVWRNVDEQFLDDKGRCLVRM